MISKNRRVTTILVTGCFLFSFALRTSAQSSDVAQLNRVVDRIEARYGNMRGLAAEFEQIYSAPGVSSRRETGRVFLARPHRMRWEYDPKPGKLFIVNERDVWLYVPADREATHADIRSVSDWRFPLLFLLGSTNLRREFNSIEFAGNEQGVSDAQTLRLLPRRNGTDVKELFLIATSDGRILKIKLVDEGGGVSEVSLRNTRENYIPPAAAFDFQPPPGVTLRTQR
jgi:outer membrane lipoprotein-sorting protein